MSLDLSQLNVGKVNQPALSEPSAYVPILVGSTDFPQISVVRPDLIPFTEVYDRHVLLTYATNAPVGSTSTRLSAVSAQSTAQTLMAANSLRRGLIIYNDSTGTANIKFGSGVTVSSFSFKVSAGQSYESPLSYYAGIVTGIWTTSPTGSAFVTEIF